MGSVKVRLVVPRVQSGQPRIGESITAGARVLSLVKASTPISETVHCAAGCFPSVKRSSCQTSASGVEVWKEWSCIFHPPYALIACQRQTDIYLASVKCLHI